MIDLKLTKENGSDRTVVKRTGPSKGAILMIAVAVFAMSAVVLMAADSDDSSAASVSVVFHKNGAFGE